ncbi:hypothetical protein HJC23_003093 [Cyclotella cryptica]|uniref:Uncharacterized protein n=1 Tax=Cyclotella cryptica TaxID=29204 RepID=A0ABD3P3Y3_9STRA
MMCGMVPYHRVYSGVGIVPHLLPVGIVIVLWPNILLTSLKSQNNAKKMKTIATFLLAIAPLCLAFAPPATRLSRHSHSHGATQTPSTLFAMPDGGVVITGSAGGVGFAYAGEFMDRGYDVVICDVKDCSAAAKALTARHPTGRVFYTKCDVSDAKSCEDLGKFAKEKLGNIGYWINNAGINGGRRALTELTMQQVETVVKVNLLGILYCTKVAMDIMAEQEGMTGHIFNTVGSGVKGGGTPGYATYGATKRGLPQLTASLVKEIDEGVQGYEKKKTKGSIQVHSLSPGMVFTKLLLDGMYFWTCHNHKHLCHYRFLLFSHILLSLNCHIYLLWKELRKFPFGVLAAQPEEVAADLVPKILAQKTNGGIVEFLTTDRILTKFFERFVLQKKSEYIDDDGNVIKVPGEQYDADGVRALY